MTPPWQVQYKESVLTHDIPTLDRAMAKRIRAAIESKLMADPVHFGKPLRYSLTHQRSLRVGDYRVLYHLDSKQHRISITAIGHRRDIYED